MRWDLLEKFEILRRGDFARALKRFSGKENFFKDHFPTKPLVPEVLFVEMIAQVGGVLYGLGFDFKKEVILAKVSSARFLRPVSPPCSLVVEARVEDEREEGAVITGVVKENGILAAEARILLVTMDSLSGENGKCIVFSENFLKQFDIYRVVEMSLPTSRQARAMR